MKRIVFPRELLLVEVDRRCREAACGARVRVGLTKEEARVYTGFECERCGVWNEDVLSERDIPEWWEELKITSLDGVRPSRDAARDAETAGAVARLSEAWGRLKAGRGATDEETSIEEESVSEEES
jgi:hypothetical protein